jgi:hypothetical protein
MDCIADETIVEYKTSAKSSSQKDADELLQLTLYSWAYRMIYGRPEQGIRLVTLVRTKTPKIQVLDTKRDVDDYRRAFGIMAGVLRAVNLHVFYRNTVNHQCESCVYREECCP